MAASFLPGLAGRFRSRGDRERRGVILWSIVAATAVLVSGFWLVGMKYLDADRAASIAAAEREHANLASFLAERNDHLLGEIEHALREYASSIKATHARTHRAVGIDEAVVRNTISVDPQGRITSPGYVGEDVSRRDYFRWHRDNASSAIFVGAPFHSALLAERVIPVSLRMHLPDGRFGGVVAAAMKPDYFAQLFAHAELGDGGCVMFAGVDTLVRVARCGGASTFRPAAALPGAGLLAAGASQGSYVSGSAADGVVRYMSYRRLANYPDLLVATGSAEHDVLKDHVKRARIAMALLVMASGIAVIIAGLSWVGLERRRHGMKALESSESRYRQIYQHAVQGIFEAGPDWRLMSANAALARICGYPSVEHLIRGLGESDRFLRAARRAEFQSIMEAASRVDDFEYELVRADGSVVWVSESSRAVRDAAGGVVRYEGFVTEIETRKREEQVRHEASELAVRRYQELLGRLRTLARTLKSADDLHGVYLAVLEFVRLSAPVCGMLVTTFDAARRERRCAFAWKDGRHLALGGLPARQLDDSPHGRALASGEVVITQDLATVRDLDDAFCNVEASAEGEPARSSVVVPMQAMGQVLGAVEIRSSEHGAYGEEHVAALRAAAPFVGMAMYNVRLLESERAQRRQAQEAEARHRKVAEELRELVDGSIDAICIVDRHDRFVRVSAASRLIWGYEPEEMVGRRLADLVHPDDRQRTREAGGQLREGLPLRGFENRHLNRDGGIVHLMWSARWRPEDQTMFCVARDVTEARLMAEARRHLAERLRDTIENLGAGFATLDSHWRLTYINREGENLTGRSRRDVVGVGIWKSLAGFTDGELEAGLRRAMAGRVPVQLEHFAAPLQSWFEARIYPMADGGLAVYFHDVSERHRAVERLAQSELRFEHAALATNDVIWDWDVANATVWFSPAMAKFGYDPTSLKMDCREGWGQYVHPDDRDRSLASFRQALEGDAARWSAEYRLRRGDGTYAFVADHASIIRDASGRPYRVVGGISDITDRRDLERRLMRAQRLESIGTLAGGIAHDLNNVLTPIMMGVNLLASEALDEEPRAVLETMRLSVGRGAEIVRQVLSFARGVEGARAKVDLPAIIGEIERMVRETFPRNIEVEVDVAPDLPPVMADATQLHQVILNLCVNARDAMAHGGVLAMRGRPVELAVPGQSVQGEVPAGRYACIEVRDSGHGMDEATLDRIFEPFFTTKPAGEGTGLGLPTTLGIVRNHGGYVQVASEPGKGSCFALLLPACKAQAAGESDDTTVSLRAGAGQTVMLVDDERSIREVGQRALASAGYRVVTAANGSEALAIYRAMKGVDLVVTDMMMPVMDGSSLIRALAQDAPSLPIVCVSGLVAGAAELRDASVNVHGFLHKPYTVEALLGKVQEALG